MLPAVYGRRDATRGVRQEGRGTAVQYRERRRGTAVQYREGGGGLHTARQGTGIIPHFIEEHPPTSRHHPASRCSSRTPSTSVPATPLPYDEALGSRSQSVLGRGLWDIQVSFILLHSDSPDHLSFPSAPRDLI